MNWFWVITVQWNNPSGTTGQTVEGTISAEQAARMEHSRAAAFKSALDAARRHLGIPDGVPAVVLFFSLDPAVLADGSLPT